jgi:hypothetical protein
MRKYRLVNFQLKAFEEKYLPTLPPSEGCTVLPSCEHIATVHVDTNGHIVIEFLRNKRRIVLARTV